MTDQQPLDDNMQGRINNIFTGQDLPSYANVREVEAMKARIQELEDQLAQQNTAVNEPVEEKPQKQASVSGPIGGVDFPSASPQTGRFGWFSRIWSTLTDAHASITETGERNSARLAASFLFIIILLLLVGGLVRMPRVGLIGAFSGPFGIALLTTAFAYGLIRTKWYQAGIFIFALSFGSLAYVSMISGGADADISSQLLVYVPLSLIVASTFLNSWAVFLLTGLNIGAFLLTTRFGIQFTPDNFGAQAGIVTTIGFVLIALSNFRKQNEKQQIDVFRKINQELDLAKRDLEQRVAERTHDLELASEVGRTVTARVDNLYQLLADAVELIRTRFNLYYTQVYLTDRSGRIITLRAGTGETGKQLLQRGHNLLIDSDSLNGRAALEKHAVIVADTSKSVSFLPNPLLPLTRSEMAMPLMIGDRVVGVLDMQSDKPNALNESNLPAFEAMAGQLAVAIQNASLFEEVNQARSEVEEQAKRQSYADWTNFLNAVERSEKIGFIFNQSEVMPLVGKVDDTQSTNSLNAPLHVAGAEIGKLHVADSPERQWTPTEEDIIQTAAAQLSRHIENLRLLAEAEKYRLEAEQAVRRLTREGWDEYLKVREKIADGFVYAGDKVQILSENGNGSEAFPHSYPIQVRDEVIGELSAEVESVSEETEEIIASVAKQLSDHIENLRLLETTQYELAERVRTEQELMKVRLGMDRANDAVFMTDTNGVIQYINPAFERIYGWTAEEVIGQTPRILKSGVIPQERYEEFWGTLLGKQVVSGEIINKTKDGRLIPIEGSNNPIVDSNGNVIGFLSLHRDITERKQAEELIRTNEARLSEALDIARLGNWAYDVEKDLFTFNDQFYSIFRTSVQEVGSYQISSAEYAKRFVHPDDAALVGEEIGKAMSATERLFSRQLEHRIIFADGSTGYIAVSLNVERDENGKIIRWYGANQDITERKLTQNLIAERANQLETVAALSTTASTVLNPDRLLQTVVDLTKERFGLYHAHVYLVDESWNTLLLAAGAGETGKTMVSAGHAIQTETPKSFVARAYRERKPVIVNDIHDDEGFLPNPLLPHTHAEMAVPMVVGDKVIGVFDVQSKDAGYFTADDALVFNTLAAQVAVALQNARLYQEQAATVTQLRELDRLKSSFLANMSHELRTPLNSILGFTDVMLEGLDGALTPYMQNDLSLIQKNGQHLLHLINDVLDMAKIESGKLNLIIEKFQLQEIFEEVVSITSPLASEKSVNITIEDDSDHEVEISADRTRLRQVLLNLVNNAVKFTDHGKVSMRVIREANNVLISVKDTGLGIPASHLESVFQEFTQVDSSTTRKAGGTGLGLPISRRLIQMHGGRLWAESTGVEGEGSTFYVFLPIEAKVAEPEITSKS